MMNSSSVTPPQRISREENAAACCFFTWYCVRAGPAGAAPQRDRGVDVHDQRQRAATARITHSRPAWGSIGSPSVRRWWAYSL